MIEDLYDEENAVARAETAREYKDARLNAEKLMREHVHQLDREVASTDTN